MIDVFLLLGISIHTALAGCDPHNPSPVPYPVWISIHTALAGCDFHTQGNYNTAVSISIHTALAGCDSNLPHIAHVLNNFNPHSPRRL